MEDIKSIAPRVRRSLCLNFRREVNFPSGCRISRPSPVSGGLSPRCPAGGSPSLSLFFLVFIKKHHMDLLLTSRRVEGGGVLTILLQASRVPEPAPFPKRKCVNIRVFRSRVASCVRTPPHSKLFHVAEGCRLSGRILLLPARNLSCALLLKRTECAFFLK